LISAVIIAHSICALSGKQIVTFELEYPRLIHSELMTHRLFSRNAASSRAIPISKVIEMVRNDPAMPVHWGKNQPGMQANEELDDSAKSAVIGEWCSAALNACDSAEFMMNEGAHKQVANRLLEPFQRMKTVLTFTEGDNWFWLRRHTDADPTIKALADAMWEQLKRSVPDLLYPGQWHMPYVSTDWDDEGNFEYWLDDEQLTLEQALMVSSSCCAQVSYRRLDGSLEKAEIVYKRLVESEPVHASPFEHQATPMRHIRATTKMGKFSDSVIDVGIVFEDGATHLDKHGFYWSGNFKGWIQHRQLINKNTCWDYEE
jgi:hypothetical protein